MRRRDHAHIGPDRLVAADALECLLLQHAQELGLEGQRHVSYLVEKNGTVIALLELANAAAVGPSKGALLVSEKLTLQKGLGDRGAVERQEGRLGPGAVLIDGAGDQLFPGATFAADEDRQIVGHDTSDGLVDFLHRRARAEDGVARQVVGSGVSTSRAGTRISLATRTASSTTRSSRFRSRGLSR